MPDTPEFLPFARPSITDAERSAVLEVLDSGWLTTGPRTREFEERFAEFVGASHAVAVNSATAGLHLALEGIGVAPGDEVIVPTWTFASSAAVVTHLGARPVIVDIERASLNMTPEAVLAALTNSTKAVIAVHVAGQPMEIGRLAALLEDRRVAVIEDAAHSFPSLIGGGDDGRFAGTVGRAGVFSFYATKTITTGEGGMVVTEDDALADRVRQMSLHGISRGAWDRYAANGSWYYEIEDAGFKYNMTDLAAAIGVAQLARARELLAARQALQRGYESAFLASRVADLLELPPDAPDGSHAWHLYVIRLHLDRLRIDRAGIMRELQAAGIGVSVHFIPLHRHPYYRTRWGTTPEGFPNAEREYPRVISLPIWAGMRESDVDRVVSTIEGILEPRRA